MKVYKDYSLKSYNTFGIDVKARYFTIAKSVDELFDLLLQEPAISEK